ncbi:MAG: amidohydrolase family protein [Longimonas sp.]|uniref:amidohydrolase family protein n=1 Tax=Longimonas sp. TaxID=2039626 RepID=UPI003357752A
MIRSLLLTALLCCIVGTAAAQSDDDWDVNTALDPEIDVSFTVDEGTWMNVDVHPDGDEIVFDLLGDIYTLPIEGGTATRITSGPSMTIQPRYSPDGSRIAFTSDQSGGDNIWTMTRTGDSQQQVTDESFRLLNNPAWTPDGNYIVARKHFTSRRSLGAGEMWMYHRAGGTAGIQLTERRTDQKDAGEPVVSPDGRYLYWSEDITPGQTFEYDKDPNGIIYAIRQLDRETGDITTLISGRGSAMGPQVSPDGEQISFVRRVRNESVLFLYDMETGAETPIFEGLSRDQQETWAIFGPYPSYSWHPNGEEIVIYGKGKLHRVDVETGDSQIIPFEAEVEQQLAETVHSQQELPGDTFRARMLRDAATSPDGQTLVFHAAGHLYRMALPDGTPERLTSTDHFAYAPAFSPDGQRIVYTTWSDEDFGTVRSMGIDGSSARTLVDAPGYYHSPQFSPDGATVVYRRASGNSLIGTLHSIDTGLYTVDAAGGEPTHITEDGRAPRFTADGERIYYLTGGGLSKAYRSVDLNGGTERTHFTMRDVSAVVPSPDGNWVAFQELFHVYVAPFPQTGGSLELTKDTQAIPVAKVSEQGGSYLHWSGDSERLHWMAGPEHFTLNLDDAFAFLQNGDEVDPTSAATTAEVDLTLPVDRPSGQVAFTNARIITMNGDEVIENGTLIVEEDRIAAVGAADAIDVPAGAHVIDADGHTLIPGLVDAHAHEGHFFGGIMPQTNWYYHANLAFGITTIHDPSANTENVFNQSEMVRAGHSTGPRVFSTGRILYGADGDFRAEIDGLDDARFHLNRLKAVGAFSVKSYNQPRRDQRQQVLQAARELDMLVYPEGGSTFYHNMNMIQDGHTGIEHNIPVAPLYSDMLQMWEATDVGYTPTLVVSYGGYRGEHYFYHHNNVWENDRLLTFVPRPMVDERSRRRTIVPEEEYFHFETAAVTKDVYDLGQTVQIGGHGQMQGIAPHWELWMFEQGGMTPHEALRSATMHGATYLGMDHELGSLEAGKRADIVVLRSSPLDDIRNSEDIAYVMKSGRLYDAETMNEVGNHPRERGTFYFERDGMSDHMVWDDQAMQQCTCDAHSHVHAAH